MAYIAIATNKNDDSCVGINYAFASVPFYLVDTINGGILVWMFIKRLTSVKLNKLFLYITYIVLFFFVS